ncbi:hypothetical protein, partial [Salmonella enterica]|uniref:hypothetical protein n=1 Tax=Salmonella enterica TaxID=28901 RepID=UPI00307A27C5
HEQKADPHSQYAMKESPVLTEYPKHHGFCWFKHQSDRQYSICTSCYPGVNRWIARNTKHTEKNSGRNQ